jgi:hypothetical protein
MCNKCEELDRRTGHLRKMVEQLADPQTIEAANSLIADMEAKKAAFHPQPKNYVSSREPNRQAD